MHTIDAADCPRGASFARVTHIACLAGALTLGALALVGCGDRPQPNPPAPSVPAPPARELGALGGSPGGTLGGASGAADAAPEITDFGPLSTPDSDPRLVQVAGLEAPKPATWIWQQPTMQFRTIQYAVPGSDGAPAAEFIVSAFLADGGQVDANLERWRRQFRDDDGQPVTAEISKREIGGLTVHLIDLRGSYAGMGAPAPKAGQVQRGAIIEAAPATIYLRLLGPAATVDANAEAWQRLIDGLRRVESAG